MDNNMTAIVCTIMIALGFLNGMTVTTLLDKHDIEKMNKRLAKVLDDKFDLERDLDDLREELEHERREKEQILAKLNSIVRQFSPLPPPEGPLERSQAVSDSDSEDEEFPNPASPDAVQRSKD